MEKRITGHTELIGLIAYPIRHTSSPTMHNAAFAKLGLDYAYLAFEVDNNSLEGAVQGIRSLQLKGSNVSMPNKTVVHKYLDKISPAAEMCGAVNTIVNEDGVLTGHITDGTGYMMSLKDNGVDVIGKKMTIVGAGGAATSIEIQAALDGVALDKLKEEIATSYLFTNATGMGMKPLEGKTYIPDKSFLRPDLIVSDVVYFPRETELLRMAKEVGCKTMNGLGMMLFQGAAAFKLWTGEDMPIEYMKEMLDIKY